MGATDDVAWVYRRRRRGSSEDMQDADLGHEAISSVAPALESRIGAFRRLHRLPGVIAGLATRDGLRWWHASGFADLETARRSDRRTLFRIASVTKTITATAV